MDRPKALIADDERVLGDELRAHLEELWPELQLVGQALTGIEALALIERHAPDMLFLDIRMPGLTGLEIARHCEGRCHIVFVTAYDAHAVAAFEQGAVDYVLKPYDRARIALALQRLRGRLDAAPPALGVLLRELAQRLPPRQHLRWITAGLGGEVELITVDEVCYFQAYTKYTRVVLAEREALISLSLRELQAQLDPSQFWPIHRSYIVNASAIAGVARDMRGHVQIRLKQRRDKLPVSQPHSHLFRQM